MLTYPLPKPSNSTFDKDFVLSIQAEMLDSLIMGTSEESFDRLVSHTHFLFRDVSEGIYFGEGAWGFAITTSDEDTTG